MLRSINLCIFSSFCFRKAKKWQNIFVHASVCLSFSLVHTSWKRVLFNAFSPIVHTRTIENGVIQNVFVFIRPHTYAFTILRFHPCTLETECFRNSPRLKTFSKISLSISVFHCFSVGNKRKGIKNTFSNESHQCDTLWTRS